MPLKMMINNSTDRDTAHCSGASPVQLQGASLWWQLVLLINETSSSVWRVFPRRWKTSRRQGGRGSNRLPLQVEVDGGKVEVSGEWNLAATLLPVTINGTDRTLQVRARCPCHQHFPSNTHTVQTCMKSLCYCHKSNIPIFRPCQCLSRDASGRIVLQFLGTSVRPHLCCYTITHTDFSMALC